MPGGRTRSDNEPGRRKIRVLLIEDESWFRSYVVPSLNGNGFDVVGAAASFDDAARLIDDLDYDLALVDIELSNMDTLGLSLIPMIRRARPNAKVAIFSGYLDPQSDLVRRARSQELSVDGILRKFMDVENVHDALRTIVDNPGIMWVDPTLRQARPSVAVQKMTAQELTFLRDFARRPLERKVWAVVSRRNPRDFDNRMAAIKRKILEYDLYPEGDERTELSNLEVFEWARKRGLHFE
jgi:DNA-binding NarL/FixJ family response regulator